MIKEDSYIDIYEVITNTTSVVEHNTQCFKLFINTKALEGCTKDTINNYLYAINRFVIYFNNLNMKVSELNTRDIRKYLQEYQENSTAGNLTLDNLRRTLSSFYHFLEDEMICLKNPMNRIHRIKYEKTIKSPFSDEECELLRDASKNDVRDRAIIDFLFATGVRVSELCKIKLDDINLNTREVLVYGKGSKQRIVYFDAKTKIHIMDYLKYREENSIESEYLFLTKGYNHSQLTKSGVEWFISKIGASAGVSKCHPHRFRRTFATSLLIKGMPIEQVRILMGHTKIDTTLIYAQTDQEIVKVNYKKIML